MKSLKKVLLHRSHFHKFILAFVLWALTFGSGTKQAVLAQTPTPGPAPAQDLNQPWNIPVNLSQSGAASAPRVVIHPEGGVQVFWWDQFDGLMTSIQDGPAAQQESWTDPVRAPLETIKLTSTPDIIADTAGWVHAFWIERDPEVDLEVLFHSQMTFGSSEWSNPELVANSTAVFDVIPSIEGGLYLAYIRTQNETDSPSGVYVRTLNAVSRQWEVEQAIATSIYYRLLSPDKAWVHLSTSVEEEVAISWTDPRLNRAYSSISQDGGVTWSSPEQLGGEGEIVANPRYLSLPDGDAFRFWRVEGQGECELRQQRLTSGSNWTNPEEIFEALPSCPADDHFWLQDEQLLWIWGEGSGSVVIAVWDSAKEEWSQPYLLSMSIHDSTLEREVNLIDLHIANGEDQLIVVGHEAASGEIWINTTRTSDFSLIFAPQSPWSEPTALSDEERGMGLPGIAMDQEGRAHLIWNETLQTGKKQKALFYAQWFDGSVSKPFQLFSAAEGEIARHPALLVDRNNQLHLVWSGGLYGGVYYSSAIAREASSPSSWTTPQTLSVAGVVGWPQIGMDASGTLYVVYVVSQNEGRGVYLIVSENAGKTWSQPQLIFDGQTAGWQVVDHPALAVEMNGTLHIAWVNSSPPDTWLPRSIVYSFSTNRGASWSEPVSLVGEGFDRPKLALASDQLHILFSDQEGGVWHRWMGLDLEPGAGLDWSSAARIPGWIEVHPPLGVAVDGAPPSGTLHIVGANLSLNRPLYSIWNGEQWSNIEAFSPLSQSKTSIGAVAATVPQGGTLAVAWAANPIENRDGPVTLYFLTRAIATVEAVSTPVSILTPTPVETTPSPSPSSVPTTEPSPTPDLNRIPGSNSSLPVPPLALGSGLAAVIVIGALITYRMFSSRKN